MIKSFGDNDTETIYAGEYVLGFPRNLHRHALKKLMMINAAKRIENLMVPPGNRLETLKGKRRGHHSIRINDQWRVTFRWEGNDAHDVTIEDYHE